MIFRDRELRALLRRAARAYYAAGWHRWEIPGLLRGLVRQAAAVSRFARDVRLRAAEAQAIAAEALRVDRGALA